MTTTWRLDRLSTEFVGPITVTRDGIPVTGWKYALLARGQRPATAADVNATPDTLDGGQGVLVGPGVQVLTPGVWYLWIRYTDNPEIPVLGPADIGAVLIVT